MKHNLHNLLPHLLCAILGAALPAALPAAVPLRWTVETSRLQPAVFDTVRGETLALEASFTSYGKPVATTNQTAFLCWQTNGMDSAWWTTNAVALAGNKATALFTPAMDPGAATVTGFICLSSSTNSNNQTIQQSNNYRAAFTLRYRHGPGETPNALPIPTKTIDFAEVAVQHPDVAPWVLKGGTGGLTPQDATNAALAVIAHVSNTVVTATNDIATLATQVTQVSNIAASARLTSANAGANIRIGGSDSNRWLDNNSRAIIGYSRDIPTYGYVTKLYYENTCVNEIGIVYTIDASYGYEIGLTVGICTLDETYYEVTVISAPAVATTNMLTSALMNCLSAHGGTATREAWMTNGVEYVLEGGADRDETEESSAGNGSTLTIKGGGVCFNDIGTGGNGSKLNLFGGGYGLSYGGSGAEVTIGEGGYGNSVGGSGGVLKIGQGGDSDGGPAGRGAVLTLGSGGSSYAEEPSEGASLVIGGHGFGYIDDEYVETNGTLTITHTGNASETLTERIVRDASSLTNGFVTADGSKTAVRNDTQLWQDCVSYQLASNITTAITSPATGSVIQRLNALEGVNALLETALNGGND